MKKVVTIVLVFSIIGVMLTLVYAISGVAFDTITFDDANLEYVIRETLGNANDPIKKKDVKVIKQLEAGFRGIKNIKGIEQLTNLVELNLEGNEIKDFSYLGNLVNLEELNIGDNGILYLTGVKFESLKNLPNLKKLSLENNVVVSDEGNEEKLSDITLLKGFEKLKKLDLSGNNIADISHLSNLVKLKELDLSQNKISKGSLENIRSLVSLEELNVRECGVKDISPVENLKNLEYLNIHSNTEIKLITSIGKLTKLKTLIMRNVPVGEQLEVLKSLTALKELNVRNTLISDVSVLAELMEKGTLQDNTKGEIIAKVDINDNPIVFSPEGTSGYDLIRPYWNNISEKSPEILPKTPSFSVFINEVMNSNKSTVADVDGEYEDWIELYNPKDTAVDLAGYYLSDNMDKPLKWKIPERSVILPKGYLLIWLSGKDKVGTNGELHTNFKITSDGGEAIVLTEADGEGVVDYLVTSSGLADLSYGRKPDGSGILEQFGVGYSTPSNSNNNSVVYMNPKKLKPNFSHNGGFYEKDFSLELKVEDKETKIYYTLDGSEPDPKNVEGAGEEYKVKYSYTDNDNSKDMVTRKNITYVYDDSTPIVINDKTGLANDISTIATKDGYVAPSEEILKATVVRARAYKDSVPVSVVETHTYFVGEDISERHVLPVISIASNNENFFDYERGIYVPGKIYDDNYDGSIEFGGRKANYNRKGEEWERPINIEFFDEMGEIGFSQNVGIRIHGAYSRSKQQKTLRLHASSKYDFGNNINYNIFNGLSKGTKNNTIDQFKYLLLRNNGNDGLGTMFKDALAQSLVSHTLLDTQAYRPSVLYINGEYWGIHNIRERLDRHYIESKYDVNAEDVVILSKNGALEDGIKGDEKHYNDMVEFVKLNNMSISSNYEYIKTQMDIENYIDYYISNIYFSNKDWPQNNIKFWRLKTGSISSDAPYGSDGRWRWLLYDTDFGFYSGKADYDMFEWVAVSVNPKNSKEWPNILFKSLLKNESFKMQFISRFADHLNSSFTTERVVQKVNEMHRVVKPEINEQIKRWQSINNWETKVQELIEFSKKRPDNQRKHIVDFFKLEGTAKITLKTNEKEGIIKINTLELCKNTPGIENPNDWSGIYFKNVPVTVTAAAKDGYRFVRWEGSIEDGIDAHSETLIFTPDNDIELIAVYEVYSLKPVEDTIEALPIETEITLQYEADVAFARELVEITVKKLNLQKEDIKNIDKLTKLQNRIIELRKVTEGNMKGKSNERIILIILIVLFSLSSLFSILLLIPYAIYKRRKYSVFID